MSDNIPTSQADRQKLKLMLAEMTKSMEKIDEEREAISDTAKAIEDDFGIKKKVARKLATVMYKHTYADVRAENEHFEELYETLVEGKKTPDLKVVAND